MRNIHSYDYGTTFLVYFLQWMVRTARVMSHDAIMIGSGVYDFNLG